MELLKNVSMEQLSDMIANNALAIDRLSERVDKLAATVNCVRKDLGDRLGRIVELVVAPGIRPHMAKLGHVFDGIVPNKAVNWPDGDRAFEIDVFLDNGNEAMAVEIKSRLQTSSIDGHIQRLQTIRRLEDSMGIKNKKLYGGIAGIAIDAKAKKYAQEKGLYLFEILEDEKRLKPMAPPAGKVGIW